MRMLAWQNLLQGDGLREPILRVARTSPQSPYPLAGGQDRSR